MKIQIGNKVSFLYNNKQRVGQVVAVDSRVFTLEHDKPELYDNKKYSSYSFEKLGSRISLLVDG